MKPGLLGTIVFFATVAAFLALGGQINLLSLLIFAVTATMSAVCTSWVKQRKHGRSPSH